MPPVHLIKKYDCDMSLLEIAIENKRRVIAFEDKCASDVNQILDGFEQEFVSMINAFVQSRGRNTFDISDRVRRAEFAASMKEITSRMQEALLEKEIEATIQTYEMVTNDQFFMLQDYLDSLAEQPDSPIQVVQGGEQDAYVVARLTKPLLSKKKAKELANKKRVKKTVDERIGQAILDFEEDFMKAFDSSTGLSSSSVEVINKMRQSMEAKLRKQAEFSIRAGVQTVEEEANFDIWHNNEEISPKEFQRVEILDKKICLGCMFVDSTYNDKPLGLLHFNCRGIDLPVYYNKKGKRIRVDGIKYSKRRLSFDERFERLSQKEQLRMLGKGKLNLYQAGKLKPSEFLSNGAPLTLKEAERHVALKQIKKKIKTPKAAEKVMGMLEEGFPLISQMDKDQLRDYINVIGEQKKVISFVPKSRFPKKKPYTAYISELDEKYELAQLRYKTLKGGENK